MLLEQTFHNAQNNKFRNILLPVPAMLGILVVEQNKQSEVGYIKNDMMLFINGRKRINILIYWHQCHAL